MGYELIGCEFKTDRSVQEVVQAFETFKTESGDPEQYGAIQVTGKGNRLVVVEALHSDMGRFDHEALAGFISHVIAQRQWTTIQVVTDDLTKHGWLILKDRTIELDMDHPPSSGGVPYRDLAEAIIGKDVLHAGFRQGMVKMSVHDVIGKSLDEFKKILSEQLFVDDILNNMRYELIGRDEDDLVFLVEGFTNGQ